MDVTGLAIGVTVALAVGIVVLLAALAVYVKSRRRVEKLRQLATTTGRVQRRTTTSQLQLPDIIRRRAAANELTKRMTGYPGRMYMPGELDGMEGSTYADDNLAQNDAFVPFDAYDERNAYERRIVADRRDNESLLSDWVDWISDSSDSSSDDDTRHRSCTRHDTRRCPVQPVPVVMPAPAMTSALVHPAPVVVQPQQPASVLPAAPQPSVFVPAASTATATSPVVRPSPPAVQPQQPTPSWPSAVVRASARNYAVRDRGSAVFTAAQERRGRVEYDEQERAAVATEGARGSVPTRPVRPATEGMCTGGVDVFRRTDRGRATWHRASAVVDNRAVQDEYELQELAPARPTPAPRTSIHGMGVTARAMVRGAEQGRSTR